MRKAPEGRFYAKDIAEILGLPKTTVQWRIHCLNISTGDRMGYGPEVIESVRNFSNLPHETMNAVELRKRGGSTRPHKGRPPKEVKALPKIRELKKGDIPEVTKNLWKEYRKQNNINAGSNLFYKYYKRIKGALERGLTINNEEEFKDRVLDGNFLLNTTNRLKTVAENKRTYDQQRKVNNILVGCGDYTTFDPTGIFDDELIKLYNELLEENKGFKTYKNYYWKKVACLNIMLKYHYIDADEYNHELEMYEGIALVTKNYKSKYHNIGD